MPTGIHNEFPDNLNVSSHVYTNTMTILHSAVVFQASNLVANMALGSLAASLTANIPIVFMSEF